MHLLLSFFLVVKLKLKSGQKLVVQNQNIVESDNNFRSKNERCKKEVQNAWFIT